MIWEQLEIYGKSPFDCKDGKKRSFYGHACSVWGKKLIIYGGKHENRLTSAVWMMDLGLYSFYFSLISILENKRWIEISQSWVEGEFPIQRWKHACAFDYYSHLLSRMYRDDAKEELEQYRENQKITLDDVSKGPAE